MEEGRQRLTQQLKRFGLWNTRLEDRIVPVLGDLSEPLLGLSQRQFADLNETIDVIYSQRDGGKLHLSVKHSKTSQCERNARNVADGNHRSYKAFAFCFDDIGCRIRRIPELPFDDNRG
jgi:hypothetical protein